MGWLKAMAGIGALAGAFYLGKYCARLGPYEVQEVQGQAGQYALVERATGASKVILPGLEVGTLEQRVSGALRESKRDIGRLFSIMGKEFPNHFEPR